MEGRNRPKPAHIVGDLANLVNPGRSPGSSTRRRRVEEGRCFAGIRPWAGPRAAPVAVFEESQPELLASRRAISYPTPNAIIKKWDEPSSGERPGLPVTISMQEAQEACRYQADQCHRASKSQQLKRQPVQLTRKT